MLIPLSRRDLAILREISPFPEIPNKLDPMEMPKLKTTSVISSAIGTK
jgi:hypothetical protein